MSAGPPLSFVDQPIQEQATAGYTLAPLSLPSDTPHDFESGGIAAPFGKLDKRSTFSGENDIRPSSLNDDDYYEEDEASIDEDDDETRKRSPRLRSYSEVDTDEAEINRKRTFLSWTGRIHKTMRDPIADSDAVGSTSMTPSFGSHQLKHRTLIDDSEEPINVKSKRSRDAGEDSELEASPRLSHSFSLDDIAKVDVLKEGRYRMGSDDNIVIVPYIIVPSKVMQRKDFSFDDIFKILDLDVPSIIFNLNRLNDSSTWNVRLPTSRKDLEVSNEEYETMKENEKKVEENLISGKVNLLSGISNHSNTNDLSRQKKRLHYDGVLRANCKRLLRCTMAACQQATAYFRVESTWSVDYETDVFAQWLGADGGYEATGAVLLGLADVDDFSLDIMEELYKHAMDEAEIKKKKKNDVNDKSEIIPKYTISQSILNEIANEFQNTSRDQILSNFVDARGRIIKSFPNPSVTHMIISDNLQLLEKKLFEFSPSGLIVVNGDHNTTQAIVNNIQLGNPVVAFKYSGGAADFACEMYEYMPLYLQRKKLILDTQKLIASGSNIKTKHVPSLLEILPFDVKMASGFSTVSKAKRGDHDANGGGGKGESELKIATEIDSHWLLPFNKEEVASCVALNILLENWPDRHNPQSVFIVDLFATVEDDVQDRITQTMAVVFEAEHELGGQVSETKRLTYAWRTRHKFVYNAFFFKWLSDVMMLVMTLLILCSTGSAVIFTFFELNPQLPHDDVGENRKIIKWLLTANLLLPLIATVIRGIFASVSPNLKYIALKNASVRVEAEIYMYRCKVGKYSTLKKKEVKKEIKDGSGDGGGKKEDKTAEQMNPSKTFSAAIDQIWSELAASDLQNGSLRTPINIRGALDDINARIKKNRKEQMAYLAPMQYRASKNKEIETTNMGQRDIEQGSDLTIAKQDLSFLGFVKNICTLIKSYFSCFCSLCTAASKQIHVYREKAQDKLIELQKFAGLNEDYDLDDGIQPMSADVYVRDRIIPMAAHFTTKAPYLSAQLHMATVIGVLLSVVSSAISRYNSGSIFIPAVLALSGSITALMNYHNVELRLLQTNAALNQLNVLLVWWDGLTMIEKRVPLHKETLVKSAEATISAQATIFSGGSSKKDDDDKNGGDEKKK